MIYVRHKPRRADCDAPNPGSAAGGAAWGHQRAAFLISLLLFLTLARLGWSAQPALTLAGRWRRRATTLLGNVSSGEGWDPLFGKENTMGGLRDCLQMYKHICRDDSKHLSCDHKRWDQKQFAEEQLGRLL